MFGEVFLLKSTSGILAGNLPATRGKK